MSSSLYLTLNSKPCDAHLFQQVGHLLHEVVHLVLQLGGVVRGAAVTGLARERLARELPAAALAPQPCSE